MANYIKTNIYINNDLVFSEEHPRHGWTQQQVALLEYQVALQKCGYALNTCWFEELNEGGWITYMRADEVELEEDIKKIQYNGDFNDDFLNHYIKSIKNYKPSSLTIYEWIKPLSIFGIKLDSNKLTSDYLGKLQEFDHIPSVPEIKSVLYDHQKRPLLEQSLMCLDIPNSLHLPLSFSDRASTSKWVINFYYLDEIIWTTKGSEYPLTQSSYKAEAEWVKYILEEKGKHGVVYPGYVTLEIVTKKGPIYRKLDSFQSKLSKNGEGQEKISCWFEDIVNNYYEEVTVSLEDVVKSLKCLGFIFNSDTLKLSHSSVGEIKAFSPTEQVVYPDIKAAIWEREEFKNALNTICITNPLHLPWSVYEGVF